MALEPSEPLVTPVNSLLEMPVYSMYSATAVSKEEAQFKHKIPPLVSRPVTEVKIIPVVCELLIPPPTFKVVEKF